MLLAQTFLLCRVFFFSQSAFFMFPKCLLATTSISLPFFFSSFSYPIQLDDDARLAILVSIVTVIESRAFSQNGSVELTGALGVVLHIAAVLLQEVLVRSARVVLLGLDGVVVSCRR